MRGSATPRGDKYHQSAHTPQAASRHDHEGVHP